MTFGAGFRPEYSGFSFELGGSSNMQQNIFETPPQRIPPVSSPVWDLNSPPSTERNIINQQEADEHDDNDDNNSEPSPIQQRPQRQGRRPRCGTGSHILGS